MISHFFIFLDITAKVQHSTYALDDHAHKKTPIKVLPIPIEGMPIKSVVSLACFLQKFYEKIHRHIVSTDDIYKYVVNVHEQEFSIQDEIRITIQDSSSFAIIDI